MSNIVMGQLVVDSKYWSTGSTCNIKMETYEANIDRWVKNLMDEFDRHPDYLRAVTVELRKRKIKKLKDKLEIKKPI